MQVFSSLRPKSRMQLYSMCAGAALLACPSLSASGFSVTTSALGGYEVLSYRDDPTKLDGGSVSAGDSFEQASYQGAQFGVNGYASFFDIEGIEPIVGAEVLASRLKKVASSEGYSTQGTFNFVNGTLGVGARAWLADSFSLNLILGFSQALSNKMKTTKTSESDSNSLGELDFTFTSHKRTSIQLGAAFAPAMEGLLVGLDLRLGSGCFSCSSANTPEQKRAYLTRSGALTVAYMLGEKKSIPTNKATKKEFNEKLKKVAPRRPVPKKPSLPKNEESFDE